MSTMTAFEFEPFYETREKANYFVNKFQAETPGWVIIVEVACM